MNRTEAVQTYRVTASGIAALVVSAREVNVPPAGMQSLVVSLRLPYEAALRLQGRSAPVLFEVSLVDPARGRPVVRQETSTFFVPR